MIICRAQRVSRHYTAEPIFTDLEFQIQSGDRIGLVGPNGAGKSTLIKLLAGIDQPDSGQLHFHPEARVALLAQFPDFSPGQTLLGEVRSAMRHLEDAYHEMLRAGEKMAEDLEPGEQKRWSKRYDDLQELLRRHGGFQFEHRVQEVLLGLRFTPTEFDRPLASFSGGQQSRAMLARLLLGSPDLMLLDEPTNHLDIETVEWLESYLSRQQIAMIIVSHDRSFLDRTVNQVYEILRGRLTQYIGNYQSYLKQRAERQKAAEREITKKQEAVADLEEFIRRNKAGQLAKQAKSREKMLARLQDEDIERPDDWTGPRMAFGEAARSSDVVFAVRNLAKSFDKVLFSGVSFEILRGERVGIMGPNGAGKTTLLRILLGEEFPSAGEVKVGANVRFGYLDQTLSALDIEQTPLEAVRPPWKVAEREEPFRALLARFGIHAGLADKRLATMSGGERTRTALAKLCAYEVNCLVLDEPTNHLDLWAVEALESAITSFGGTVLVVSHDRTFLNQVVNRLIVVEKGGVSLIMGNYDVYLEKKLAATEAENRAAQAAAARTAPTAKPGAAAKRKRRFPYRKTEDIEADIAVTEQRITELEAALLSPDVFRDGRRVKEVNDDLGQHRAHLEQLLLHWEEAMELN